jgi:hypothetical protein
MTLNHSDIYVNCIESEMQITNFMIPRTRTTDGSQWRIHRRGRVPPEIGEEGIPMYWSPRFHSTIVVDIRLGRYRAIKYSAPFDDTRPI